MNERLEGHPTDDEWDSPAWNDFVYGHLQGAMMGGAPPLVAPEQKNKLQQTIKDIEIYVKWTLEDWGIIKPKPQNSV